VERWRKLALNAVEQSHRSNLPMVTQVMELKEILEQYRDYSVKLIPTLSGDRKPIKEALAGTKPNSILALIGPEGDFTPSEIEEALSRGFIPISLGDSVLRVETAAIAIASYLRFTLMEEK
jgi:16S rRNA (uracil1498-N3)-methyltransferase